MAYPRDGQVSLTLCNKIDNHRTVVHHNSRDIMSKEHPHANQANDAAPDVAIERPTTFGPFDLDEAVIESKIVFPPILCSKYVLTDPH